MAANTNLKKVTVTQTRSSNRHPKEHLATLRALGLGRIGKSKVHTLQPATLGMLRRVSHLVVISGAEGGTKK